MFKTKSVLPLRASLLGLAGLTLTSMLMIGCEKKTTEADVCGDNGELCVARALLVDTGTAIFAENCTGCHGEAGNGQGHGGPVIANSDYVMGSTERLVRTLLEGVNAPIVVNGKSYPGGTMPAWESFSNYEIAGLATYIRSVLNDSLASNCVETPSGSGNFTCTMTARDSTVRINDTVPVWFVKSVRDAL